MPRVLLISKVNEGLSFASDCVISDNKIVRCQYDSKLDNEVNFSCIRAVMQNQTTNIKSKCFYEYLTGPSCISEITYNSHRLIVSHQEIRAASPDSDGVNFSTSNIICKKDQCCFVTKIGTSFNCNGRYYNIERSSNTDVTVISKRVNIKMDDLTEFDGSSRILKENLDFFVK